MKEPNIEELAVMYGRLSKWMKGVYPTLTHEQQMEAESFFPELKMSEYERIRKWISKELESKYVVDNIVNNEMADKALAWLEKQGEHADFLNKIQIGDKVTRNKDGVLVNLSQLNRVAKKYEKQGEPNPYSGVSFKYNGHTWGMCARDNGVEILVDGEIKERVFLDSKPQGKSALEAINEEKVDNANKVEPKFKVEKDKWYVCTSQYCNCIEGRNYKASLDGRIIDDYGTEYDIHSDAYRWFRPWTIQDAKDGDVLSWDDSKCITIFKNIYDKDSFNSYGFVGGCTGTFESRIAYHNIKGAHPATREQRDLLFTKMKEAGYEWDARKKELNKVEQKEAIHKELTEFEKAVKQVMEEAIECGDTHNLKADADMLLSLVHKPGWSEEDEKILSDIIKDLVHPWNEYIPDRIEDEIKWLKNKLKDLKNRVQPQPKQE